MLDEAVNEAHKGRDRVSITGYGGWELLYIFPALLTLAKANTPKFLFLCPGVTVNPVGISVLFFPRRVRVAKMIKIKNFFLPKWCCFEHESIVLPVPRITSVG
jgi:hypothetical protein